VDDLIDGYNDKQLYEIVNAIVDLQVYTITATDQRWRQHIWLDESDPHISDIADVVADYATRLFADHPQQYKGLEIFIERHLAPKTWQKDFQAQLDKKELFGVWVHGDMWASNLLWEGDCLMGIIDWQMTHLGSITEDLQHVLATSIPAVQRLRMKDALLLYYYDRLCEKLAAKRHSVPFDFATVQKSYNATLVYSAAMAVFATALWTNSPVLRDGSANENERIAEMCSRSASVVREVLEKFTT